MAITRIDSASDPRIQFFTSLKGEHPRIAAAGVVLVEGDQQVERLLRSNHAIRTLFMEEMFYERFSPLLEKRTGIECLSAPRSVMAEVIGYRLHQGVMALVERPTSKKLEELEPPIVALNGIIDPENVGSIARNCAAFGVRSLLVDELSADPFLRRAVRVSMGAALELSVGYCSSLAESLSQLRKTMRTVAIENASDAKPIDRYLLSPESVFVFGNERNGIEKDVLNQCDDLVQVSMSTEIVSSLNVNATSAIVLARLYR